MTIVSGDLSGLGVGPVFQMLERAATSGVLAVKCHGADASFGLREGRIAWAHASFGKRVGDVLIEEGLVTEGEIALVERDQKRGQGRSAPIGTLIVAMGLASREAVARALDLQIVSVLREVMTWRAGTYDVSPYRGNVATRSRREQRPETEAISEFLLRAASA